MRLPQPKITFFADKGTLMSPASNPGQRVFINNFMLPRRSTDYAVDVYGDGRLRNQFGDIVVALSEALFDLQKSVDEAMVNHVVEYRIKFKREPARTTVIFLETPNLSSPFSFPGTWQTQGFVSDDPVKTRQPIDIELSLQVLGFSASTKIGVAAAQLQFSLDQSESVLRGQLNGIIRLTQVRDRLVPAVASLFTDLLNSNPNSEVATNIVELFRPKRDQSRNWVLAPERLLNNEIFRTVFAPDVQIYDLMGKYNPSVSGTHKDSLTFGIGLTGTPVAP
jgi:hypothetical protein